MSRQRPAFIATARKHNVILSVVENLYRPSVIACEAIYVNASVPVTQSQLFGATSAT